MPEALQQPSGPLELLKTLKLRTLHQRPPEKTTIGSGT